MSFGGFLHRGHAQRRLPQTLIGVALAAILAGCATPTHRQAPELRRDAAKEPRIVVMPLDVELSQLTAGGLEEPHSEWTDAALKHIWAALRDEAKVRKVQ